MAENKKGQKGYTVSEKLLSELQDELTAKGIQYQIVKTPKKLGEYPRPIYVTSEPSPKGWSRYGTCPKCKRGRGLGMWGYVQARSCTRCSTDKAEQLTPEKIWNAIETWISHHTVDLPDWFDDPNISTVKNLRQGLANGTLHGVGPERTPIVAEALANWRLKVLKALNQ